MHAVAVGWPWPLAMQWVPDSQSSRASLRSCGYHADLASGRHWFLLCASSKDQDTRTDIPLSGILPDESCGQREGEASVSDIAERACWRHASARCLSPPRPDGAPFGDSGEPHLSHKVQNKLSPAVPHAVLTPLHRWTPVLPTRPRDHSTRSGFRMESSREPLDVICGSCGCRTCRNQCLI